MLSAMGFGSGTLLIIFLTAFMSYGQLKAQGVNLLFFIPCAAVALIFLSGKGLVKKENTLTLSAGGAAGVAAGQLFLTGIPTDFLPKLFGVFLIFLSLRQLISLKKRRTD